MISVVSDEDYCKFYRFWTFEYAKRNVSFQRAISSAFTTDDYDEKTRCKKLLSSWGFIGWIDCYVQNAGNKLDVLSMLDAGVEIPIPEIPLWNAQGMSIVTYNGNHKRESYGGLPLNYGEAIVKIDFSLPLDLLSTIVAKEYERHHKSEQSREGIDFVTGPRGYDLEKLYANNCDDVAFEVNHLPRAIGLKMWDHFEETVGFHPPETRGAIAEAIRELKRGSKLVSSNYSASGDETFRKLYRRTQACIEDVKVLSLK